MNANNNPQAQQPVGRHPDFARVNTSLRALAEEMSMMPNLPLVRQDDAVLNAVNGVSGRLNAMEARLNARLNTIEDNFDDGQRRILTRLDGLDQRMEAAHKNAYARSLNSNMDTTQGNFQPLKALDGSDIPNFPVDFGAIDNMSENQLNNVLVALGHTPRGGSVAKKKALRRLCGVVHLDF